MASTFGQGKQHDVMVEGRGNGRVSGPVVSQVMDKHAIILSSCDQSFTNLPTWIVRRTHHFDERFITIGVKCRGVASPVEQLRLQVVDGLRVGLA